MLRNAVNFDLKNSRAKYEILINCRKGALSAPLRHALFSIGFDKVNSALSYEAALEEAEYRPIQFVFFDAFASEFSSIPTSEFIEKFCELQQESVMIAVSTTPTAENIFKVIKSGARGYLVPPFTPEAMEEVLLRATQGSEVDEQMLKEPERNKALARMIMSHLNTLTGYIKTIEHLIKNQEIGVDSEDESSERYKAIIGIDRHSAMLSECVRTAQKFCEGGLQDLLDAIVEESIARTMDKSSIRQTRKKLRGKRASELMLEN